jgi:ATP-dependent Clp protease ATP-binding subunit ClpC
MPDLLFTAGAFHIHRQAGDLMRRAFLRTQGEPGPEHILLAMFAANHELIQALVSSLNLNRHRLERDLFEATLKTHAAHLEESRANWIRQLQQAISQRQLRCADEWDLFTTTLRQPSPSVRAAFQESGISDKQLAAFLDADELQAFALRYSSSPSPKPSAPAKPQAASQPAATTARMAVLQQFGRDLTLACARQQLPRPLMRDREIQELMETLCRQRHRNAILVGEPGVGKSSIVYGVLHHIAGLKMPGRLSEHRFWQINIGAMLAGAADRADGQQRLQGLIADCRERPVILVVEDFTRSFLADRSDALAAILRQALFQQHIQCIGECTPDAFRKEIQPDHELLEVCHPVRIEELSAEQTIELLAGMVAGIEAFHNVQIPRETLVAVVELGGRHLSDRKFPGKAASLLDAAAARVSLRDAGRRAVLPEDVAEVVARLTGLQTAQLLSFRVENVSSIETALKKRIIGQDHAIRAIVDKFQISRSGLDLKPHRPDAVFLLAGPTGVGKTEMAKALSEIMQGSPNKLIRFDMSEFMEKHTVAKLIGAPPGYIGYDEEAPLCKRVRNNPRAVILFDEIEKAHADVQNIFLQIFDDGRLTDSQGQTADFSQTIILLTSNLGTRQLDAAALAKLSETERNRRLRDHCEDAVRHFFAPEFINRLDGLLVLNHLSREMVTRIAESQLQQILETLAQRGKTTEITEAAFQLVVEKGYSLDYGARHLQRTIEDIVLKPLARFLLENPQVAAIRVDAAEGQIAVTPATG